jgi:hypothetical protein
MRGYPDEIFIRPPQDSHEAVLRFMKTNIGTVPISKAVKGR